VSTLFQQIPDAIHLSSDVTYVAGVLTEVVVGRQFRL
jgi:hypothetical protein